MAKKKDYGLVGIDQKDDKSIFTHAQDIDPTIEEVRRRKADNDHGFSKKRSQRYIGSIPLIEIERDPALKFALTSGDPVLIEKAVRIFFNSEAGQRYMANKMDTGKTGQVVVK